MLTKKDKKKRYKKRNSTDSHMFGWGGQSAEAFKNAGGKNLGGSIGAVAGGVSGIIEAGMKNAEIADTTEQEQAREYRLNFQSSATDNNSLLAEMASDVSLGSTNWKDIRGVTPGQMVGNTLKGVASGAQAGAKVGGPWGAVAGAAVGLASGVAGIFAGNAKAKKKAAELDEAANKANLAKAQTLTAKAGVLDQAADARALAAYAADGGMINPFPSSEFGSPITEFNTGGSHEENPYDGIPQGIAPDGLPNLVEEGEVKYDNYIFSDRLMLSKEDKKQYKYLKGKTFADAAKRIKKDLGIDERPNDPLALDDLHRQLETLYMLQEEKRAKKGLVGENRMIYKNGGYIFDLGGEADAAGEEEDFISDEFRDGNYIPLSVTNPTEYTRNPLLPSPKSKSKSINWSSWLQAAPAIGSAIGTIASIFDKPIYEHTKRLIQPEKAVTPITYTPTHQDIRLDRFDTNYHANKLAAQAGATRRAIREQTASNPYASTAALLSADANAQSQMGDLYRKAAEYNQGVALQEAQFNSAGRRADEEGLFKAASANATLRDKALARQAEKDIYAARLNIAEDQAYDTAVSANMTSLFDNLGAIGKEKKEFALAAIKALGEGKMTPEQLAIYAKQFPELGKYLGYKAYGGKLKRKKGYTI